eukprot:10922496-Lingulodinium_polyedra.AAC.1
MEGGREGVGQRWRGGRESGNDGGRDCPRQVPFGTNMSDAQSTRLPHSTASVATGSAEEQSASAAAGSAEEQSASAAPVAAEE